MRDFSNIKNFQVISKSHTSVDTLIPKEESELLQFLTKIFERLEMSSLPHHVLTLEESTIVMFLQNLDAANKLLNETRPNKKIKDNIRFKSSSW